jgi:hypothetical protein
MEALQSMFNLPKTNAQKFEVKPEIETQKNQDSDKIHKPAAPLTTQVNSQTIGGKKYKRKHNIFLKKLYTFKFLNF